MPRRLPIDRHGSTDNDFEPQTPTLAEMLAAEGIALEPAQVELLDRYRRLLWSWNEKMNLTRHTTLEKFVTRDVVDSLQLAAAVGAGRAGARRGHGRRRAGVILAIVRPDLEGQPVRIDGKEGAGRRGDGGRAGTAGARSTPAGPRTCWR